MSDVLSTLVGYAPYALAIGGAMGALLANSSVAQPDVLRGQFVMQRWTMLRMFASGIGAGAVVLGTASLAGVELPVDKSLDVVRQGLGGALLGGAAALGGSCPGTVLAQVGLGVPTALHSLTGALLGSLAFAVAEPSLRPWFSVSTGPQDLPESLGMSYGPVAIVFGLAIAGMMMMLEHVLPWRQDRTPAEAKHDTVWNPYKSGIALGFLQLAQVLAVGSLLGTSSAYVTVVGYVAASVAPGTVRNNSYLSQAMDKRLNWYQVLFDLGIILGAWITTRDARRRNPLVPSSMSPSRAMLAGAIQVFGARLADGCTSGHGLSGTARLTYAGFVATAAMFACGIATAMLMTAFGLGISSREANTKKQM